VPRAAIPALSEPTRETQGLPGQSGICNGPSASEQIRVRKPTLEGATVPARRVNTPGHRPRSVWVGAGLVPAARVLRSHHFAGLVAVGGIMLVGLTQIGWKVLARAVRDLIAWDNAWLADLNRQLRCDHEAKADQSAAS